MKAINKSKNNQKKAWVNPALILLEVDKTNDPLKDPGTSETAFEQLS